MNEPHDRLGSDKDRSRERVPPERPMRIDILTIFPDMFETILSTSIPGRARDFGAVEYQVHDIRQWADNKHRKVDDRPFGGGPGMVLMCQPLMDCVEAVEAMDDRTATRILLTPQGERLEQARVNDLATTERLLLIAGHYEGIDERVIDALEPLQVSIGDFVVSGGELPAMLLVDAIVRLQRCFWAATMPPSNSGASNNEWIGHASSGPISSNVTPEPDTSSRTQVAQPNGLHSRLRGRKNPPGSKKVTR
jgi:hypothetical protein